jgi:hypothetical protein
MKATPLSQRLVKKKENNSLKIKGMQMHENWKNSKVVLSQHFYFSCLKKLIPLKLETQNKKKTKKSVIKILIQGLSPQIVCNKNRKDTSL